MSPSPVGLSRQIRVGERREDRVGQGGDIPRRHEAPEGGSRRGCEDFGYAAGVRGNDRDTPSQRLNDDLAKGLRVGEAWTSTESWSRLTVGSAT